MGVTQVMDAAKGTLVSMIRTRKLWMVVLLIMALVVVSACAGALARNSLSYTSYKQTTLTFPQSAPPTLVVLYFHCDGPLAATQHVNLHLVQILGTLPQGVTRVQLKIVAPFVDPAFPDLDVPVTVAPDPNAGLVVPGKGYAVFYQDGTFNMTGLLTLWVGAQRLGMGISVPNTPQSGLIIQPVLAWTEYDGLRTNAAVGLGSFVFFGLTGFLAHMREIAWPFIRAGVNSPGKSGPRRQ